MGIPKQGNGSQWGIPMQSQLVGITVKGIPVSWIPLPAMRVMLVTTDLYTLI